MHLGKDTWLEFSVSNFAKVERLNESNCESFNFGVLSPMDFFLVLTHLFVRIFMVKIKGY